MSIWFDFQASFAATPAAIREQIIAVMGESAVHEDGFLRIPESLFVTVDAADAEDTDVTMELYGFRESIDVIFTLSKADPDAGNMYMWNIVLSLLDTHEGDAALLYDGDIVMLLRRGGEVTLNQDWEWDTEPNWLTSRLPADVKLKSIPVA